MDNTLSPHASNGNPLPYTVYALTDQLDHVTWKDVRYIGLTINLAYRLQQHLYCSDSNEAKNEWIQSILAQDRLPRMHKIEEEINTSHKGRKREQYWIRYAMSQGAKLLNRAITYTEEERGEVHAERYLRYAQIAEILEQGTYVKRWHGGSWYPSRLLTRYSVPRNQHISLTQTLIIGFRKRDDSIVSIHAATNKEFDDFITPHVPIASIGDREWSLEERRDVIEYAMSWGKELEFYQLPRPEKG